MITIFFFLEAMVTCVRVILLKKSPKLHFSYVGFYFWLSNNLNLAEYRGLEKSHLGS